MKYVRTFNLPEKEIYDLCCKKEVDFSRIDHLLKNGADANAEEITVDDNGVESRRLLIVDCINDGNFAYGEDGTIDLILQDYTEQLLMIFIANGFDVEKHFTTLMNTIQITNEEENLINAVKVLLDHKTKEEINLEKDLSGMSEEQSFNLLSESDYEVSTIYNTICEMIIKYVKENDDYNLYDIYKAALGDDIRDVKFYTSAISENYEDKLTSSKLKLVIECEECNLVINDIFAYVNNNDIRDELTEEKIELDVEQLIGRTIENIEFYHEFLDKNTQKGNFKSTLVITLDDGTELKVQSTGESEEASVVIE